MHYITAIYLPTIFEADTHSAITAKRFAQRSMKNFAKTVQAAIPSLQRSHRVCGSKLAIFVDSSLQNHPQGKLAAQYLDQSGLPITKVTLDAVGYWRPKWLAMIKAGTIFGWPLLWFDFLDAEVHSLFSAEEQRFLSNREMVIEWSKYRNFGPPMHLSNGTNAQRKIITPQTSIYLLNSPRLAVEALRTNVDHDQNAIGLVFEKTEQIFQDSPLERFLPFSSRGLFKVAPNDKGTITAGAHNIYQPRITHKC
jgi:hypothetical protein